MSDCQAGGVLVRGKGLVARFSVTNDGIGTSGDLLDITGHPTGMNFVRIQENETVSVQRIILKQRKNLRKIILLIFRHHYDSVPKEHL